MSIQYNGSRILPTPGAPLRIKLDDGRMVEGCRPGYIENSTADDPQYHDRCGNLLDASKIQGWAYQAWTDNGDKYNGE